MRTMGDSTVLEFRSLGAATAFASRCRKATTMLLGEHPYFWVVSLADAERLTSKGFEAMPPPEPFRSSPQPGGGISD